MNYASRSTKINVSHHRAYVRTLPCKVRILSPFCYHFYSHRCRLQTIFWWRH